MGHALTGCCNDDAKGILCLDDRCYNKFLNTINVFAGCFKDSHWFDFETVSFIIIIYYYCLLFLCDLCIYIYIYDMCMICLWLSRTWWTGKSETLQKMTVERQVNDPGRGTTRGTMGNSKKTSQLYAICHSWSLEFISYHFSSFMTNFPWLTLLTPLMSSRYFHNDPCCGCGAMWSPKERERWKSGKAMQWTCNVMCSAALMCLGRVLGWRWSLERMKTIENQFVEPCWTIVCPQNVYIYIYNYKYN